MQTFIAYYRVSTDGQGRSGLGLEAQRAQVTAFVGAGTIIAEFIEVETGKGADALENRPELARAIALAKKTGAVLVVAKLDRLTRNVQFGATLMNDTKVQFKVAELPHANNFMLHIMLAVAEQEREMISQRTKAALAARRDRGLPLGSTTIQAHLKAKSSAFAEQLRTFVSPICHLPSRAIADQLNAAGITSPKGSTWSSVSVLRLLSRLELA